MIAQLVRRFALVCEVIDDVILFHMSYKLLKFIKETALVAGAEQSVFVALIKKDDQDQPFKVSIEHFDSAESAKGEVMKWIGAQEDRDARVIHEAENAVGDVKNQKTLDALNEDIES